MAVHRSVLQTSPEETFLDFFVSNLDEILRHYGNGLPAKNDVDFIVYKIDQLMSLAIRGSLLNYIDHETVELLINAYNNLEKVLNSSPSTDYKRVSVLRSGCTGRPSYDIRKEMLIYFLDAGFSQKDIACIIGVCDKTVARRIKEFDIRLEVPKYSHISDAELGAKVLEIITQYPSSGIRIVKGHLASQSINITWERVRDILWEVDPEGILNRSIKRPVINRRVYNVPGSLALWHIDGNHKLIRWGFVVHGGVDGFSRKVMFLQCNTNNRASTVFNIFHCATLEYGLPSRVRADQGTENVEVAKYMFNHPRRGPGRRSFIAGKSCHNQRIERLWRDVFSSSLYKFYCVFWYLEDSGLFDINNELHLYVLHLTFLPRINVDLHRFAEGWSDHSIRTAKNRTPNQLWILGQLQYSPNNDTNATEEDFGVDYDGPIGEILTDNINIPKINEYLDDNEKETLFSTVNIMSQSTSFGVDIFIQMLHEVQNILSQRN